MMFIWEGTLKYQYQILHECQGVFFSLFWFLYSPTQIGKEIQRFKKQTMKKKTIVNTVKLGL